MVDKQIEDTENPSIEIAAKTRTKKQPATAQTKEKTANVKSRRTSRKGSGGKTGETKRTVRNGSSARVSVEGKVAEQPIRKLNALERATAYADAVLAGDIIAGPHVRNACRRFHDDLAHGRERGIYFNVEKAQRVFDFFEQMLKLSDGQFEGKPLILAPSQAFKIANLFGFMQVPKDADGNFVWEPGRRAALGLFERRRFRRAYIEEGKGNGKSPLAGGIGLYGLMGDGEGSSQIYAAAAKKDQANILFHDACKMVRAAPSLLKRIKFSGSPGKEHNMAFLRKGAFFRPISREAGKSGSGPRPLFALCDEVHEHPDRTIMEMLERGFKFRVSPLLLMITNSGTDKQSICWEEHEWACKVAAGTKTPDENFTYTGEPIDDVTFSYVCALDIGDDPLTDSSCWVKANPMLNIILSEEYLAGVVKQAVDMPGKRNGILRLHFCVWTDSVDAWMGKEIVDRAMEHFDPYEIHKEKEVAASIDLSASRDLTAAAFVVETGEVEVERQLQDGSVEIKTLPTYDAWIEAWTPKDTMVKRESEDHQPYLFWSQTNHVGSENQPYLRALPGERIRHDYLAGFFQDVDSKFKILGIAYDRYQYDKFREECDDRGLDLRHVAHPQGGKFRAKPDPIEVEAAKANKEEPPLGLWMPGSIKALEDAFTDGRIRLRFSPVLMSALMGATLSPPDDHGNKWFIKSKATVRIDPAVALAMAFGLMQDKPRKKKPKQFQLMVF